MANEKCRKRYYERKCKRTKRGEYLLVNGVKAKIYWVPEKDGGRKNIPTSQQYSTVACFEDIKDKYPEEAWSVVVDLKNAQKEYNWVVADIKFLMECAPHNLLYSGSKFELYEGARLVATGEIL